uniref:Uncharacterized protein n=1 Tax=Oryza brachyantha TaxID=4533 RepID=J3MWK6_ORYBR
MLPSCGSCCKASKPAASRIFRSRSSILKEDRKFLFRFMMRFGTFIEKKTRVENFTNKHTVNLGKSGKHIWGSKKQNPCDGITEILLLS